MAPAGVIWVLPLLIVGAGGGLPAGRAAAIRVELEAPAGCSSAEAFRRAVASRLERAPDAELAAATRLQVKITRAGARVEGELRLVHAADAADTRRVEGKSCDEVIEVLALTAALALQGAPATAPRAPGAREGSARAAPTREAAPPRAPAREATSPAARPAAREAPAATEVPPPASAEPAPPPAAPPPPPPPEPPAPPATSMVVVSAPPAPPPPPTGTGVEVGAAAALGRVLAPGLNLGGSVMLGLTFPRAGAPPRSLRLALLYLPQDLLRPAGEVGSSWLGGALTACPGPGLRRGWFEGQACARALVGWVTATDQVVTTPRSAGRSWWAAGALLRGGAPIGAGLVLELEAGVDAVLIERRFITTTPLRTVADTPPVSILVGLGLSRRL